MKRKRSGWSGKNDFLPHRSGHGTKELAITGEQTTGGFDIIRSATGLFSQNYSPRLPTLGVTVLDENMLARNELGKSSATSVVAGF